MVFLYLLRQKRNLTSTRGGVILSNAASINSHTNTLASPSAPADAIYGLDG